jgi:hypothetical protein
MALDTLGLDSHIGWVGGWVSLFIYLVALARIPLGSGLGFLVLLLHSFVHDRL